MTYAEPYWDSSHPKVDTSIDLVLLYIVRLDSPHQYPHTASQSFSFSSPANAGVVSELLTTSANSHYNYILFYASGTTATYYNSYIPDSTYSSSVTSNSSLLFLLNAVDGTSVNVMSKNSTGYVSTAAFPAYNTAYGVLSSGAVFPSDGSSVQVQSLDGKTTYLPWTATSTLSANSVYALVISGSPNVAVNTAFPIKATLGAPGSGSSASTVAFSVALMALLAILAAAVPTLF